MREAILALVLLFPGAAAAPPAAAGAEEFLEVRVVGFDHPDAGRPLPGARVGAARVEGPGPFDPEPLLRGAAAAGEDGQVRIPRPAGEGRLLVAAVAEGFAPAIVFALPPEAGAGPVRVALRRAGPVEFLVTGLPVVVAGAGPPSPFPLRDAWLRLTPGRGYEEAGDPPLLRSLRTDAEGRGVLPDLALGPFFDLEVRAAGFAGRTVSFVLAGGSAVEVLLEPAGRLSGRVLRVPGGGPVQGALVAAGGVEAMTGADGTFLLEDLGAGVFPVEASHDGTLALDRPLVRVEPGRTVGVPDLRLALLGRVRVLLRGRTGAPVVGAVLRLLPAEGAPAPPGPPATAVSGSDGAALLSPVAAAAGHRVLVEPPEPLAPRVTTAFAVLPGEALDLGVLTLDGGGVLAGTVLDAEGFPAAGATVTLFDGEEDPLRVDADPAAGGPLRRTVPCAADGTFRLERVPAGSRSLLARAPDRLPAALTRLPVEAGKTRGDLALVLRSGAAVEGTLLDEEGVPLVDALVTALHPPLEAEGGRARTGPGGTFRLEGLPAGACRLRVLLPGEPFPDPLRPLFDAVAPSEGTVFRIPASLTIEGTVIDPSGEEPRGFVVVSRLERGLPGAGLLETLREVERFPVPAGGAFTTRPLPEGRYRLRVESPDGRLAAADAEIAGETAPRVDLLLAAGSSVRGRVVTGPVVKDLREVSIRLLLRGREEAALPPATVEESGAFLLTGVPVGEHDLVVSLPGLAPVVLRHLVMPPEGGVVEVGDVLLGQGATLRVRLFDETRAPMAGVAASLEDGTGLRREETTGAAGLALFSGLARGAHLLVVRLTSGAILRRPVDVPAEGELEEVFDFGLDPPGEVAVRRSGAPVPGAAVRVIDLTRGAGDYAGSSEVVADHGGVARVPGLSRGPVLLEVTPPGEPPVRLSLRMGEGALVVDLPEDGIEGTVIRAADGKGVPGAEVRAWSLEPASGEVEEALRHRGVSIIADGEGRFRFPSLPTGSWMLEGSSRGWGTTRVGPLRVLRGGGVLWREIPLERAGGVRGSVRDGAGRPVPGAVVEATETSTGQLLPGGRVMADASGRYALDGVAPGLLVLTARAGGLGASPPEALSLAPGEERELDLVLVPGGTLEVFVVGAGAVPVAGASVEVRDFFGTPVPLEEGTGGAGAPLRGEGRTAPDGTLRVPGLRVGVYQVRAWLDGAAGATRVRVDGRHGARTIVVLE